MFRVIGFTSRSMVFAFLSFGDNQKARSMGMLKYVPRIALNFFASWRARKTQLPL